MSFRGLYGLKKQVWRGFGVICMMFFAKSPEIVMQIALESLELWPKPPKNRLKLMQMIGLSNRQRHSAPLYRKNSCKTVVLRDDYISRPPMAFDLE